MFQSFFNKPCMACHKRPAKIKFIKIIDGDWQECMICQFCAQSIASEEKSGAHLKLDHVFESLLAGGGAAPGGSGEAGSLLPAALEGAGAKVKDDPMCPSCGLSYSNYRPTLMLGCSECYEAFGDKLADDLRRIHGATRHRGRKPPEGSDSPAPTALSEAERSKLEEEAGAAVGVAPSPESRESAPKKPASEGAAAARRRAIRTLRKKLQEAVEAESFDKAASLRDQIKALESEDGDNAGGEA